MSKVLVWKCDTTGKLFEDQSKYKKHLRKVATQKREERKIQAVKDSFESMLTLMGNTVRTAVDLENFITDNWETFYINGRRNSIFRRKNLKVPELTSISITNLRWNPVTSNSHSCPRNGVTNWGGRKPGAPYGYPGWSGRISYTVKPAKNSHESSGSEPFAQTGINTGSGGGGGSKYSYDLKLFADDFPAMLEEHENQMLVHRLST